MSDRYCRRRSLITSISTQGLVVSRPSKAYELLSLTQLTHHAPRVDDKFSPTLCRREISALKKSGFVHVTRQ